MVRSTPEKGPTPEQGQQGFLTLDYDRVEAEVLGKATQKGTPGWRFRKVGTNEIVFIENSKIGRGVGWWPDVPEEGRGAATRGSVLNDPNFDINTRRYNTEEGSKTKKYVSSSTGGSRWNPFDGTKTTYPRTNPIFNAGEDTSQMTVPTQLNEFGCITADDNTSVKLKFCGMTTTKGATTYKFKVCDAKNQSKTIYKLIERSGRIGDMFSVPSSKIRRLNWEPVPKGTKQPTTETKVPASGAKNAAEKAPEKEAEKAGVDLDNRATSPVVVDTDSSATTTNEAKNAAQKAPEKAAKVNAAKKAPEKAAKVNAAKKAPEKEAEKAGVDLDNRATSPVVVDTDSSATTEVLEFMAAPFGALVTICGSFLSMAWIGRSYY